jgi:hypothetical protein
MALRVLECLEQSVFYRLFFGQAPYAHDLVHKSFLILDLHGILASAHAAATKARYEMSPYWWIVNPHHHPTVSGRDAG